MWSFSSYIYIFLFNYLFLRCFLFVPMFLEKYIFPFSLTFILYLYYNLFIYLRSILECGLLLFLRNWRASCCLKERTLLEVLQIIMNNTIASEPCSSYANSSTGGTRVKALDEYIFLDLFERPE